MINLGEKFDLLCDIVCKEYNLEKKDLIGKNRKIGVPGIRSIMIYILRINEVENLKEIAEKFEIQYHDALSLSSNYIRMVKDREFKDRYTTISNLFQKRKELIKNQFMENSENQYYLCSSAVIQHFPDIIKSKPIKCDGYINRNCHKEIYYVIAIKNFHQISNYYTKVIEPFNNLSNVPINFWLRICEDSNIPDFDLNSVKSITDFNKRLFLEIENIYNVTSEENIAYAIYKIAKAYGMDPIQFINKIS